MKLVVIAILALYCIGSGYSSPVDFRSNSVKTRDNEVTNNVPLDRKKRCLECLFSGVGAGIGGIFGLFQPPQQMYYGSSRAYLIGNGQYNNNHIILNQGYPGRFHQPQQVHVTSNTYVIGNGPNNHNHIVINQKQG